MRAIQWVLVMCLSVWDVLGFIGGLRLRDLSDFLRVQKYSLGAKRTRFSSIVNFVHVCCLKGNNMLTHHDRRCSVLCSIVSPVPPKHSHVPCVFLAKSQLRPQKHHAKDAQVPSRQTLTIDNAWLIKYTRSRDKHTFPFKKTLFSLGQADAL